MSANEFFYWLKGYFDLNEELKDGRGLGAAQVKRIQEEMDRVTPPRQPPPPAMFTGHQS